MAQLFKNNAASATVGSTSSAATSISVASGAAFPAVSAPDFFLATLIGYDSNGNENAWEIVRVTGRSANTLTVVRAQEGTAAATWPAGTRIEARITAGGINAIVGAIPAEPSAATFTYTGGVLTGISETLPGGTRTTTLSYTSGVLTSIVVVFGGITRTTTYTYTDGVLTSIATVES